MMKTDEHVRALSDYVLRLALVHAGTKNRWSCPRGYGRAVTRLLDAIWRTYTSDRSSERTALCVEVTRIQKLREARVSNRPTGDALQTRQIWRMEQLRYKRLRHSQAMVEAWERQVRQGIPAKWATIVHIDKYTSEQPRVEFHKVRAARSNYQRRHRLGGGTRWEVTVRANQPETPYIDIWGGKDCMFLGGFVYMKQIPDKVLVECNLPLSGVVSRWIELGIAEQNAGLAKYGVDLLAAINAAASQQPQRALSSQTRQRIIEL